MGSAKFEDVNFGILVEQMGRDEIVLPDFQRGFVWKDKNKQKALIASVLTKLPIGTILLLETKPGTYGCKKIGLKNVNTPDYKGQNSIQALLDGQQRVTVLTAFFSNELLAGHTKGDLVSPALYRRYFLKLPTFKSSIGKMNWFGVQTLVTPEEITQKSAKYPKFSTGEIKELIELVERRAENAELLYGDIDNVNTAKLTKYCTDLNIHEDGYMIPLYYLFGSVTKTCRNHRAKLNAVLAAIAAAYQNEIVEYIRCCDDNDEVQDYVSRCFCENQNLEKRIQRDLTLGRLELKEEDSQLVIDMNAELEDRGGTWAENMRDYLDSCLDKMEFYKINVDQSNILRAIDIYENLNLGGKSLDIFDLILARAATQQDNKNLLDTVSTYILRDHKEDYADFVGNCIKQQSQAYDKFVGEEYSASSYLECWNKKEHELAKTYCEALMDLMGILHHFQNENREICLDQMGKIETLSAGMTKSSYLLKIEPEKIEGLIKAAAKGLDRACLFLQLRCGIRKIGEVHYKLMLVLLGCVFSKDEWFKNCKVNNYMEAWYWAAIFSGAFKVEQNSAFDRNMKAILRLLVEMEDKEHKPDFLIKLCNGVFQDDKFANEEILLAKNEYIEPAAVLSDTICQFYLSRTYKDILRKTEGNKDYEQNQINVFTAEKITLEKHHIMPIGSLETKYKKIENYINDNYRNQNERKNKKNMFNSPLNFVWISKNANGIISNNTLDYYSRYCDNNAMQALGIKTEMEKLVAQGSDKQDDHLQQFLDSRYRGLCADLCNIFETNLDVEGVIEDLYDKSKYRE